MVARVLFYRTLTFVLESVLISSFCSLGIVLRLLSVSRMRFEYFRTCMWCDSVSLVPYANNISGETAGLAILVSVRI